jgi:ABC-type bacteriocin/lantibiotic exporter with double-glycine peptidase domain
LTQAHDQDFQSLSYKTMKGVENLTLHVLSVAVIMTADLITIAILSLGTFLVNPFVSLVCFILFTTTILVLNKLLGERSAQLGEESTKLELESIANLNILYFAFRELFVSNRISEYLSEFKLVRREHLRSLGKISFFPFISKYVVELILVLGALLVGLSSFSEPSLQETTTTIAIFLGAGSRIAPAVLRFQQSYVSVKSFKGMSKSTEEMISKMQDFKGNNWGEGSSPILEEVLTAPHSFHASVLIEDLRFKHANNSSFEVSIDSLQIPQGARVAIVGRSGSGKSTLVDLMLGVVNPQVGHVLISGETPMRAYSMWKGKCAYVPQETKIFDMTLGENIALRRLRLGLDQSKIREVIFSSRLEELYSSLQGGEGTILGAGSGVKLSGGEAQRVGIARAFYSDPKLVIMDEATSALDAATELEITNFVASLEKDVTLIIITHRLSTILKCDQIVYMDSGSVIAKGTFNEVRSNVKDFDTQAGIQGISRE